jgi:hypothetical protein
MAVQLMVVQCSQLRADFHSDLVEELGFVSAFQSMLEFQQVVLVLDLMGPKILWNLDVMLILIR